MEISQFYVAERYTDMRDVYSNTLGALCGGMSACVSGTSRANILRELRIEPFPALLLAAFIASRLYPFVPVIDAHKYIACGAAAAQHGDADQGRSLSRRRHLAGDLLSGRDAVRQAFRPSSPALLIAALIFGGEIVVIDARLSLASVLGAAIAYLLWFALLRFVPGRISIIAIAFSAVIMIERLAPLRLSPVSHGFEWVPFLALLRAPIDIGLPAMIEKFFLYGGLIWLLMRAGLRLWRATVAVAVLLLFCSIVETYMPGRSAGITDALLALLIGTLLRLTLPPRRQREEPEPEAA